MNQPRAIVAHWRRQDDIQWIILGVVRDREGHFADTTSNAEVAAAKSKIGALIVVGNGFVVLGSDIKEILSSIIRQDAIALSVDAKRCLGGVKTVQAMIHFLRHSSRSKINARSIAMAARASLASLAASMAMLFFSPRGECFWRSWYNEVVFSMLFQSSL